MCEHPESEKFASSFLMDDDGIGFASELDERLREMEASGATEADACPLACGTCSKQACVAQAFVSQPSGWCVLASGITEKSCRDILLELAGCIDSLSSAPMTFF